MPNYAKLRDMVSHRIEFEYDSGARIIGYLAQCKPGDGDVLVVNLERARMLDADGNVIEAHDVLSFVPNVMVGVRIVEGPEGRTSA